MEYLVFEGIFYQRGTKSYGKLQRLGGNRQGGGKRSFLGVATEFRKGNLFV